MLSQTDVKVRRIEQQDVQKLWSWHLKKNIYLFSNLRSHLAYTDLERDFKIYFGNSWDYIIEGKPKSIIAICSYNRIDWKNRFCTISFQSHFNLSDMAQVRQGLKMILAFLFMDLNLNKIQTLVPDLMSDDCAILEDAGFEKEGLLRKHTFTMGKYHNVWLMALHQKKALNNWDRIE